MMESALDPTAMIIETPRLILRPYMASDLDLAVAALTDPRVTRYVRAPMTPAEVTRRMPLITRRGAGGRLGLWAAQRRDTGAAIGDGALVPLPVEEADTDWSLLTPDHYPDAEIEVGYMLLPEAWGQGFATEMCGALLRFAFTHTALPEVVACTDPDNAASRHVLTKCGLRAEGMRRAYAEDVPGFRITRTEWCRRRPRPKS